MSARQIEVCAERLPFPEKLRFLEMLKRANALFLEAVALRREAWRLYRSVTGMTTRGKVARR